MGLEKGTLGQDNKIITREGFSIVEAQSTVRSLVLVLALVLVGLRGGSFVERGQHCRQVVHSLLNFSLLRLDTETELADGLGSSVFTAVVVHGPRTAEAVGGSAGLWVQSWKRDREMRIFSIGIKLNRLTLTGTGSVLVGSTASGGGQSEFVQLVDQQFINVVRLVLRNAIPNDDADDEESG